MLWILEIQFTSTRNLFISVEVVKDYLVFMNPFDALKFDSWKDCFILHSQSGILNTILVFILHSQSDILNTILVFILHSQSDILNTILVFILHSQSNILNTTVY